MTNIRSVKWIEGPSQGSSDERTVHFHVRLQLRYLPLALGQKASHFQLVEGLGGSVVERGKRNHPGVGKGLGARQPASGEHVCREAKAVKCCQLAAIICLKNSLSSSFCGGKIIWYANCLQMS